MPVELPELVVTSKTQDAQTIRKILEGQGLVEADYKVEANSDQPEPTPELVVETPAPEPTPTPIIPAGPPAGDTDEDDEDVPPDTPPEPAAGTEPKKKSGSAKLKEKLTAKEQENAQLKADLERLRAQAPTLPATPAPATPAVEATLEPELQLRAKPKFEDFDGNDDQLSAFSEALNDWKYDEREFKKDGLRREEEKRNAPAKAAAAAAEAENKQVGEQFQARVTTLKQTYPTIEKEIIAAGTPTDMLSNVIMREEDSAELALWLARNPDEFTHINEMTRTDAKSSQADVVAAIKRAQQHVGRIRYILSREGMPEGTTVQPPPSDPAPPAQPPPPAAAAPPAPTAVRPKPTPPNPVGSRGSTTNKTLAQMTEAEVRNMHPDEFRQRVDRGEMRR